MTDFVKDAMQELIENLSIPIRTIKTLHEMNVFTVGELLEREYFIADQLSMTELSNIRYELEDRGFIVEHGSAIKLLM